MSEGYDSLGTVDFDPEDLANQTSSVIMFLVLIDCSSSVYNYVDSMNKTMEEVFMQELKKSHRANDIVVKCILFDSAVNHKSGFRPITALEDDYLKAHASGMTLLYAAVNDGLDSAIKYRQDLELQGVDIRTNVFIVTDGDDTGGRFGDADMVKAGLVKDKIETLRRNEAWSTSFTFTMLGVGRAADFKKSCVNMGLDPDKVLVNVSNSAEEIRKAMGVVSQSVSSSTGSATVTF